MVSSAFLLLGLTVITRYILAVHTVLQVTASDTRFKAKSANVNEIPYQMILQNLSTGKYFCGGALVSKFFVVTAAQCVYRRNISEIVVLLQGGAITLAEDFYGRIFQPRFVREKIVHEQYDPRDPWRNDIALLRFGMYFDQWERRIVAMREPGVGDNDLARVSGYGITSESQNPSFLHLKKQYTYVSSREYCQSVYNTIQYNISDTQICAYDPYNHIISEKRVSDIGGPLIINGELAGIASSTFTSFLKNVYPPMIFTSVPSYRNWIYKYLT